MAWIKSFFSDNQGNFSITRAIFAIMILNAIAMGWVVLLNDGGHIAVLTLVSGISSVGVGLKFGQNVSETQNLKTEKEAEIKKEEVIKGSNKQVLNG